MVHSVCILCLMVSEVWFLGTQQVPQTKDQYSLQNVRSAMKNLEAGVVFGGDMKTIPRLGDACSIAILKSVDEHQLLEPKTVEVVLAMLNNAFAHPENISIEEDKNPKVTIFLLSYLLDKVSAPELQIKIRWTIRFVRQQTGQDVTKPHAPTGTSPN